MKDNALSHGACTVISVNNTPLATVFRYYESTDTLSIYFIETVPGLIYETDSILPGLLVDYTKKDHLVSMDISTDSGRLPCHMYDTHTTIDLKPPLVLSNKVTAAAKLSITFTQPQAQPVELLATDDPNVCVGVNEAGQWAEIIIADLQNVRYVLLRCAALSGAKTLLVQYSTLTGSGGAAI